MLIGISLGGLAECFLKPTLPWSYISRQAPKGKEACTWAALEPEQLPRMDDWIDSVWLSAQCLRSQSQQTLCCGTGSACACAKGNGPLPQPTRTQTICGLRSSESERFAFSALLLFAFLTRRSGSSAPDPERWTTHFSLRRSVP